MALSSSKGINPLVPRGIINPKDLTALRFSNTSFSDNALVYCFLNKESFPIVMPHNMFTGELHFPNMDSLRGPTGNFQFC